MTIEEQIKKVKKDVKWLERERNSLLRQVGCPIVVTRSGSWPSDNPRENPQIRARIEKLDDLIAERKGRLTQLRDERLARLEAEALRLAREGQEKRPAVTATLGGLASTGTPPASNRPARDPEVAKRRAIVRQNPEVRPQGMCTLFDDRRVPLPKDWLTKTWTEAYKNKKFRPRIQVIISKDKKDLA